MSQKRHEKLTAQAESDIRSYQEKTADLTDRIESVHAKEISSLSETIDELKGRLDEATKARKHDDNMLLKEANRLRESAKTTESQLRRLQQQLDSKSQEFEMEKRERKETEARLAAEIGRTYEKSNEAVLLEKTQDELRSVEKKLRAANEREIKTKAKLDSKIKEMDEWTNRLEEVKRQRDELATKHERMVGERDDALGRTEEELASQKLEWKKSASEVQSLRKELETTKSKHNEDVTKLRQSNEAT
ncbi:uncharacterized protein C458.02c-like, partial [Anneissia japonica]|uniref:uncharacterized protein C458.02c-like n=1 Tax=Anneissia japonica TaxID=1529436 RepID=UPI0014259840